VSGTPINTAFFVMGSGGISSVQPGNITGIPSPTPTAATGATGASSVVIAIGSGANDATALNIPVVTRNTIANDRLNPPPVIGGQPSGDTSAVLPRGQSYPGTAPAPSLATAAPAPPSGQTSTSPPLSGVPNDPPPRYPPSVVPPVFPFQPGAGSMTPPAGSTPGLVPYGSPPVVTIPFPGGQPAGPARGTFESPG
jgi:hypothetical protein